MYERGLHGGKYECMQVYMDLPAQLRFLTRADVAEARKHACSCAHAGHARVLDASSAFMHLWTMAVRQRPGSMFVLHARTCTCAWCSFCAPAPVDHGRCGRGQARKYHECAPSSQT
eukprot:1157319-Pelagomonas_calceolata.AAC.11